MTKDWNRNGGFPTSRLVLYEIRGREIRHGREIRYGRYDLCCLALDISRERRRIQRAPLAWIEAATAGQDRAIINLPRALAFRR